MRTGNKDIDQRKLIDRLGPSEEMGEYEGFWATTYDMQPEFFETDFLPALLNLGSWNDRHWTTRISMEKHLTQMSSASVLIDAYRYQGRPRSLRVEVLPARGIHNNPLHAKVLLAVHEHGVRLLVGSSNLTEQGYRQNIEVSAYISASMKNQQQAGLIRSAIKGAQELLIPWWSPGVKQLTDKALAFLNQNTLSSNKETEWFLWGGGVISLAQSFVNYWPSEESIHKIHVVSPFWSDEDGNGPVSQFIKMLRDQSGKSSDIEVHLYACPNQLSDSEWRPTLPISFGVFNFRDIRIRCFAHAVSPEELFEEVMRENFLGRRALHAKVVLVEGEYSSLAYLGSANFTRRGWGFLTNPLTANIEAGLAILRSGKLRGELSSLIPNAVGNPVELHGKSSNFLITPDQINEDAPWPLFITDIRLTPKKENSRELELVVNIKKELVKGVWEICLSKGQYEGSSVIISCSGNDELFGSYRADISSEELNTLLTKQEVIIRWWEYLEGRTFPINVSIDARDELPISPENLRPSENLLIAYYQGRITYEELFPPEDLDEREKASINPETELLGVDTSGILSYQIREFVESLDGIRQDLKLASGSERGMRLALLGPVSPVELARCVFDSLKEGRSPTAVGFQLVEILACICEIAVLDGNCKWEKYRRRAQVEVESLLVELIKSQPNKLGPGTTFQKYLENVYSKMYKETIG